MKNRIQLIAVGIIIFIVAAAVAYKLYFGANNTRGAGAPQPGPAVSQRGPLAGLSKTQGPAAAASPAITGNTAPSIAYEYNPKGRRDPFATLIVNPAAGERKKGPVPLENYDIAEFRLTGILWSNSAFYGMITAPDGKSYIVSTGERIGLHGGKVYKILRDSLIVRELLKDYRGVVKPKDTVLKLRREEEG